MGLEDAAFWSFSQKPEENRCAFFAALSRAKREVMFTFCKRRYYNSQIIQSHKNINEFFELLPPWYCTNYWLIFQIMR